MEPYVAIDFETATSSRASVCEIGLCVIDSKLNGSVARWLVRPPGNEYDQFNTWIHGIGPNDTKDAPSFSKVWPEVEQAIGSGPLVAHYGAFDFTVLRDEHTAAGRPLPELQLGCTVVLARRAFPGLSSYSLVPLSEELEIPVENHHQAAFDAAACAQIAAAVIGETGTSSLDEAAAALGVQLGSTSPAGYRPCLARALPGSKVFAFDQPNVDDLDGAHPLFDRTVAFTGTLAVPRREAAQELVGGGGHFSQNLTGKCDLLVCGDQDLSRLAGHDKSSKLRKAEDLRLKGHGIEIISEADFWMLLGT